MKIFRNLSLILWLLGSSVGLQLDVIEKLLELDGQISDECTIVIFDYGAKNNELIRAVDERFEKPIVTVGQGMDEKRMTSFLKADTRCVVAFTLLTSVADLVDEASMLTDKVESRLFILVETDEDLDACANISFGKEVYVLHEKSAEVVLVHSLCQGIGEWGLPIMWKREEGFIVPLELDTCPHPFHSKHLRISTRGLPPFNVYKPDGIQGVDVDLVNIIAQKFHFTFNVVVEPFMGKEIPKTGEWLGVVGSVKNGTSAFGIGNPALDAARFSAVDYTVMLYTLDLVFISPKPKLTPPYLNILKPFSSLVWALIIVALIVATLTLFLLIILLSKYDKKAEDSRKNLLDHAFLYPYATLIRQDNIEQLSYTLVRHRPTRILVLFWSVFAMLVTFSYSCNLRAFLVTTDYEKTVDTAQDILDLERPFYIADGTSLEESIDTSPLKVYKELKEQAKRDGTYFVSVQGWLPEDREQEVLRDGGVLLFPLLPMKMRHDVFQQQFGKQPYRASKEVGFSYHCGFLVPKHAPWKASFDRILSRVIEMGFIFKLKGKYFNDYETTERATEIAAQQKFTLSHVLGAYLVLAVGIVISFVALLLEKAV